MFVLDSDTLTLALQGPTKVARRVLSTPNSDIYIPAIVVEQQLRGRMAALAGLNSARIADRLKVPFAYDLLLKAVRELQTFQHLPYTAEMEALYQSWPASVKRVGTRDCRIAATAIVLGFIVITCNLGDYQPIPAVETANWNL